MNTTPTQCRLECEDVTVRFSGLVAVDKVSLQVGAGSIVGLVGPNGAGKSTLFSVLSGLLRPASGRVRIDGVEVTRRSPQHRARMGLARTFQHPEMFSGLTVREHVSLAFRVSQRRSRIWTDAFTGGGFRPPDREEVARVDELLEVFELGRFAMQPVEGLPLGITRLVELARALALDPSVVLLDEPSSGLDARETDRVINVLRNVVRDRGVSLLLVEHDVSMVLGLCSYVNVLDFGRLIAAGAPDEIRRSAVVKSAYLGDEDAMDSTEELVTAAGSEQ